MSEERRQRDVKSLGAGEGSKGQRDCRMSARRKHTKHYLFTSSIAYLQALCLYAHDRNECSGFVLNPSMISS